MAVNGSGSVLRVVVDGAEHYFQPGQQALIGREGSAVDLPVASADVSRVHARLRWDAGGWQLEDLGSTNGTYVGGRPVRVHLVRAAVDVMLGHPGTGAHMRLEPLGSPGSGQRANSVTVKLVLLVTGILVMGMGLFVFDWVTYDFTIESPIPEFGDTLRSQGGTGLDFDEGKVSLVAGAISGIVGALGLGKAMSRRLVGWLLVSGAAVVTMSTAIFLGSVRDQTITVPGLTGFADASVTIGGPVTIFGAFLVGVAGLLFALERDPRLSGR